jgi:protein-S-isoprenylcysteine O-methyltransferase Ste14
MSDAAEAVGWSIWSALLFILWWALQYRRMVNEERIFRATFPEYEDYARHVPMVIPTLTPYRPGTAATPTLPAE